MNARARSWFRRLAAVCAAGLLIAGVSACDNVRNPVNPSDYGIEWSDVVVGGGTEARVGRGASTYYTLWLFDAAMPQGKGKLIQSNIGGQPFNFIIGYGQVIAGWDLGIQGMKVGGTRLLTIPPDLAYGGRTDLPEIPANSTLVYEIELVGVY